MSRIAVIGGGPGGLMTARLLERKFAGICEITLFEATRRLGGKIQTRRFDSAAVDYEAGVAECYDYEAFGRDRLKDLVRELGLTPRPTSGSTVVLNGSVLRSDDDIAGRLGTATLAAIHRFRNRLAEMMPPGRWRRGFTPSDNGHPCAHRTCSDLLDEVQDPAARRYLEVSIHSDLATEPHLTNGLVGLRNVLKSAPPYGAQYTIAGGMEQLPHRLAAGLTATGIELNSTVTSVSKGHDGRYTVGVRRQHAERNWRGFDAVVVALPYYLLRRIDWGGSRLQRAMARHVEHYDHPGHYLRVSMLFDEPFWRHTFSGSWVMLDAFGGCCVYDESYGRGTNGHAALGWLMAGADALALCNADDRTIADGAIEALPSELTVEARRHLVESRVHRWVGAVSGMPGGLPLRHPHVAHQPEPAAHEGLVTVGDYLFDSTLNGVLRSAEIATDLALSCSSRRAMVFASRLDSGHLRFAIGNRNM